MILREAKNIAEDIKAHLSPYCKRIEIAGSIRREKSDVKDIEIVLIPNTAKLYEYQEAINSYSKIKGDPLGKYTQRRHPSGMTIDFFICTSATWGCNYFIRTGSAEFIYNVMKSCPKKKIKFLDARLHHSLASGDVLVPDIADEQDVFDTLNMEWIEPKDRNG